MKFWMFGWWLLAGITKVITLFCDEILLIDLWICVMLTINWMVYSGSFFVYMLKYIDRKSRFIHVKGLFLNTNILVVRSVKKCSWEEGVHWLDLYSGVLSVIGLVYILVVPHFDIVYQSKIILNEFETVFMICSWNIYCT